MRYVDVGTLNHSPSKYPTQKPTKKKSVFGRWVTTALVMVTLGVLAFGVYSFLPMIKESLANVFSGSSAVLTYLATGGKDLQQDGGKTNVLLLGIDKRADEKYSLVGKNGTEVKSCFRTDTMIVASYNYATKKVTMLSLPRDLWVTINGFGDFPTQSTKINGAYCFGDLNNYPGGGAALAKAMVSQYLGISIQYTARVDFAGFQQAIDGVGGVDINVERAFVDYEYPIEGREDAMPVSSRYKTLTFKAGLQHMDGQTALEYARSRHATGAEGTDFARSQRQEKAIMAFKDKIFSPTTLKSPTALSAIYTSLGDSFATTLQTDELPAVYKLGQSVDTGTIKTYTLDDRSAIGGLLYAPPADQYGGAYVLVPKSGSFNEVRQFVQQIFSDEGYPVASASASVTPTK
jgi:LCP family protein required for cell wall assembly